MHPIGKEREGGKIRPINIGSLSLALSAVLLREEKVNQAISFTFPSSALLLLHHP